MNRFFVINVSSKLIILSQTGIKFTVKKNLKQSKEIKQFNKWSILQLNEVNDMGQIQNKALKAK